VQRVRICWFVFVLFVSVIRVIVSYCFKDSELVH
jgi:hypothetical protein